MGRKLGEALGQQIVVDNIWQSIVAPTGTRPAAIDKLGATIEAEMSDGDLRQKIRSAGIEPAFSTSPQGLRLSRKAKPPRGPK